MCYIFDYLAKMRLRRFIYRHPEGKKLYQAFLATLKPKNQAFLVDIIQNLRSLNTKERVRLHRIEQAFWRFLYQKNVLQKENLPLAVELYRAQELGQIGLYKDAFRKLSELLKKNYQDPLVVMQINLIQYRLIAKRGSRPLSLKNYLKKLTHELRRLKRRLEWQKIQLAFFDITQREGGSFYTKKTKRILIKIKKLPIWQANPLDQMEKLLASHMKGLLFTLTGDWEAADQAYERVISLGKGQEDMLRAALLNRWQLALYRGIGTKQLMKNILEPLGQLQLRHPSEKAVLLHHLARTAFLHSRPGFMKSYFSQLELRAQGLPYSGEIAAALGTLAWGAGLSAKAHAYYEQAKRARALEARIEAYLGQLLLAEGPYVRRAFQKAYRFLLRIRSRLLAGEFLISMLKLLAGLETERLPLIINLLETRLTEHPTERTLWMLTPLPTWLQSLRNQHPKEVILSTRPTDPELDTYLEKLLGFHFQPNL